MLYIPAQGELRGLYERQLLQAIQPDEQGWPALGTPFHRFLTGEATMVPSYATLGTPPVYSQEDQLRLEYPGFPAIPGILLSEQLECELSYYAAPKLPKPDDQVEQQDAMDEPRDTARAERYQEVIFARQRLSGVRLLDPDFRPVAAMPTSVLDEVDMFAPDTTEFQATTLLKAMANGWTLQFVPRRFMEGIMPSGLVISTVLSMPRRGPEFLYEEIPGQANFTRDRALVRRAHQTHAALAEVALGVGDAIEYLYEYGGKTAVRVAGPMDEFMQSQMILSTRITKPLIWYPNSVRK